ncbi:MAG: DUF1822 family protein [Synechococcales bacterium]|nr:DUF1822 family protein [Synechococcales bacterium]
MSQSIDFVNDFFNDSDTLAEEIVPLAPDDFETAQLVSQRTSELGKQWSVYLSALALSGFRRWLQTRSLSFQVQDANSMIIEPAVNDGVSAVCGLVANQFRITIIAIESNNSPTVPIPKTVFDRADLKSHFYLFITIYEEQEAVGLRGYLIHDQIPLMLTAYSDYYAFPADRLIPDFNQLLLHLTCLEPTAIALPQLAPPPIRQLLTQPILNTARWFQTQVQGAIAAIETATEELAWQLLPPLTFASALRELPTPEDWSRAEIDALRPILQDIVRQGVQLVPDEVRAVVRQLYLGSSALQMYVIISPLLNAQNTIAEWSLLLILKRSDQQPLGRGIQISVHSSCSTEVVQQVTSSDLTGYLFTQMIAELLESLSITIADLEGGTSLSLPLMQFEQ